ncbi:hypothetical protein LSAT2_003530 [Lamellibrachia satsuma]|nr:hypothetical protein LSAT2_003530 [Lamellibrachia satsuma]
MASGQGSHWLIESRLFLETLFEIIVRSRLVPRNTSTKTGSERKTCKGPSQKYVTLWWWGCLDGLDKTTCFNRRLDARKNKRDALPVYTAMKPSDKERLVKCRPILIRALDVVTIIPDLRKEGVFSREEEDMITKDARRRYQTIKLLDMLEKKRTEDYRAFMDALETHYPHLYLSLTGPLDEIEEDAKNLEEEWSVVQQARSFLMEEIDAATLLPYMRKGNHFDRDEVRKIVRQQGSRTRTETLLDLMEMKPPEVYDSLLEAISECYPHVYLQLTGQGDDDDDDDGDDFLYS